MLGSISNTNPGKWGDLFQDVKFPEWDCSGDTGGSTEGTPDLNSECKVDSWRETQVMGTILLSEDSADSEAPLKQTPVSCEQKAETEGKSYGHCSDDSLLRGASEEDSWSTTRHWEDDALWVQPAKKFTTIGSNRSKPSIRNTLLWLANWICSGGSRNQMFIWMQATKHTFSKWYRLQTFISWCRKLSTTTFSDKKYCTIRITQHPGFNVSMATIFDAGLSLQAKTLLGHPILLFNVWLWTMLLEISCIWLPCLCQFPLSTNERQGLGAEWDGEEFSSWQCHAQDWNLWTT